MQATLVPNGPGPGRGCWPTVEQELLLKAALFDGSDFEAAWRAWRDRVDIQRLDIGSYRVLPLLFLNLRRQGVLDQKDEWLPRIRGVYRYSWARNRLLFTRGARLIQELREAGIPTIVLKGGALSKVYYGNDGARPMTDFDLMVPVRDMPATERLMNGLGWRVSSNYRLFGRDFRVRSATRMRPLAHACSFLDGDGHEIDLHWNLFFERRYRRADDDFWARARPLEFEGVHTSMLDPTDQLLHVCVHAAEWVRMPPCRWVADALMILRKAVDTPFAIDWSRLTSQSEHMRLVGPMRDALSYLADAFRFPIPGAVLRRLREVPLRAGEDIAYQARIGPSGGSTYSGWQRLWVDHLRTIPPQRAVGQLLRFPDYCVRRGWATAFLLSEGEGG